MTSAERYLWACTEPSDIGAHIPNMARLATGCEHITEFGLRGGVSTSAWIQAKPKKIVAYDIIDTYASIREVSQVCDREGIEFQFIKADTATVSIEPTDILMVDGLHTSEQVALELENNHTKVSKLIVLHDTVSCGWEGENGKKGILYALMGFLLAHPYWRIVEHNQSCNGLTVLARV